MEDAAIVELYFARTERAIQETINKYGTYCMTVSRNILHNEEDAEECVSDTWVKAWNAIPPERPRVLKCYLAKITRNLSINRYHQKTAARRGGTETEIVLDELEEVIAGSQSVEDAVTAKELGTLIDGFVRSLPTRECNVFIRRYFYTEAVDAIAKRYGLSANNVSVMLNRTRKKLKDHLLEAGYAV